MLERKDDDLNTVRGCMNAFIIMALVLIIWLVLAVLMVVLP